MSKDYIPQNASKFNDFVLRIVQYVEEKTFGSPNAPWKGAIPEERWQELNMSYSDFAHAHETALNTPAHPNILARQQAQAETTRILRAFVNQFLRFPPVTDKDRAEMGIPNRDLIRTPHIDVTEAVEFELRLRNIREVIVNFWIKGAADKAKPHGYDGAVLIWSVLDEPPAGLDDLTKHTMASKTPYTLDDFNEEDRGKTVYIAASWQNERGHVGHWSEIQSAIIP